MYDQISPQPPAREAMNQSIDVSAGDQRYQQWQQANARADIRRQHHEKVALAVMLAAITVWTIVQVVL